MFVYLMGGECLNILFDEMSLFFKLFKNYLTAQACM